MITVRYFAGAAEAAGVDGESLTAADVGALREAMVAAHGPAFARVLERCALLADGARVEGDSPLADGANVDVLPPFAGG